MAIRGDNTDSVDARGAGPASGTDKMRERADALGKAQDEVSVSLGWRVKLLRALITGNLSVTQDVLLKHVDALSAPFTREMPAWSLEWESLHWWMLQSASPLFIASCYSQQEIVKWLLQRGADRDVPCYLKQTALHVVGECCENSPALAADNDAERQRLASASAECRQLLEAAASPPSPPPVGSVASTSEYATEIVRVAAPSSSAASPGGASTASASTTVSPPARSSTHYVQHKVYSCVTTVTWDTPDSNGAIIDKYELRYRLAAPTDASASERREAKQPKATDTEAESGWRVERATHNRNARTQRMVLAGCLQFATRYECALRSWSAAGKGEWSENFTVQTGALPELGAL